MKRPDHRQHCGTVWPPDTPLVPAWLMLSVAQPVSLVACAPMGVAWIVKVLAVGCPVAKAKV